MFEWRQHPELKWLQVSNYGCVLIDGQPKQPYVSGNGYLFFHYGKPKRRSYYVHRVVAETFIPNPDNNPVVDHISGNKLDNAVTNLRWANKSLNATNVNPFSVANRANYRFYAGEISLMRKLRENKIAYNYIGSMFCISGVTAKVVINCSTDRYLRN